MDKDYTDWFVLKPKLNRRPHGPNIKEGEIWWCSLGVNVGHEEDGKGEFSARPILIIKIFNRNLFWRIPLTTKIKPEKHYHTFKFHGQEQAAMITHLALRDTRRLSKKLGQVSDKELLKIKEVVKSIL